MVLLKLQRNTKGRDGPSAPWGRKSNMGASIENLPPLPGSMPEPMKASLTAYILRGGDWLEIGTATPHPDGKGHRLRLHIAPEDGDIIELRALSPEHYPGTDRPWRKRPSRPRRRPRY